MKQKGNYRIKLLLVGFVAAIVLGGRSAKADFVFGEPTNLGPTVNSSSREYDPGISADGLELYFNSNRPGGSGYYDLWVTTRATTDDSWGEPVNLGPPINSSSGEGGPKISSDGLSLYFNSNRPGGFGSEDLYVTTRASRNALWETPINLGPKVNSAAVEFTPCISADGLSLFFGELPPGPFRPGGLGQGDIWVTTRESEDDDWDAPVNLGPVINSSSYDGSPGISADGLLLFFGSYRPTGGIQGGVYDGEIWMTRRSTKNDAWRAPVHLGPAFNSQDWDGNPEISADGSTLFFASYRPGRIGPSDIWQAPIIPIVKRRWHCRFC